MKKRKLLTAITGSLLGLSILLGSCEDAEVTALSNLINTTTEPAGPNCASGGVRIDNGMDNNGDGVLSDDEIEQTQFICTSPASLISTSQEAAGTNCANGGVRLDVGTDANANGTLDTDEITDTQYFCNSLSSLVASSVEAAGVNCSTGGIRIDVGTDLDNDGTLDANEIDQSQFVCNGAGNDSFVRLEIGGNSGTSIATSSIAFNEFGSDVDRLTNFSKLDYPGVDSIVFAIPLFSFDGSVNARAELYDGTNDVSVVIVESNATNGDGVFTTVYSGNIYDLLPDDGSRIDLANRIASEQLGTLVRASVPSQLLLFRRN